ncbi:Fis family transcriptional regulator [Altererythrobacter sp. Root672]|nr:Fis family transcriptional regulator [Altererythrobacter sp. Root672]
MGTLETSEAFKKNHPALAARIAGMAASLFPGRSLTVGDDSERLLADRASTVSVSRSDRCGLSRTATRARLAYDDPNTEASFAALVALLAGRNEPVAADPTTLSVLAMADRLANTDIPVLINGPTGTGKEVLSRFIHNRSNRRDKPFIAVNCAAIPETMIEALLFGHQKGAFTGANSSSEGFFRAADGGTLFLDEIAEMPLQLQAKLLRALQESEVIPVGATRPVKVDVRIVAAANRDLPLEVEEGRFRADLYYRLNVFPMSLSPLRERPADIAPLAFALLLRHSPDGAPAPWISDAALAALRGHGWPGNVRELENVMRRAQILAAGQPMIQPEHIVFDRPVRLVTQPAAMEEDEAGSGEKLSKIVQISEARAIMDTLNACGGRRAEAARQLGISERTLRYRLASFRDAGLAMGASR